MVTGGLWTAARRFHTNYTGAPRWCLEHTANLFHIPWTCEATGEGRNALYDDHDTAVLPPPDPTSWFWTRCLISRSTFPPLPPR
eukprot:2700883-Pyramimonas_sp.AAC.1